MEDNAMRDRNGSESRAVIAIIILISPVVFLVGISFIDNIATDLRLFYMREEFPFLISLFLLPLTGMFFGIRKDSPKVAKGFAAIAGAVVVALLSISTTMETAGVAPLVTMEQQFKTPDGWTKQTESGTGISPARGLLRCEFSPLSWKEPVCPEVDSSWEKNDTLMTAKELESLATANGYNNLAPNNGCSANTDSPNYSCSLFGKTKGVKVMLKYEMNSDGVGIISLNLR
jgi:hypothetical protein